MSRIAGWLRAQPEFDPSFPLFRRWDRELTKGVYDPDMLGEIACHFEYFDRDSGVDGHAFVTAVQQWWTTQEWPPAEDSDGHGAAQGRPETQNSTDESWREIPWWDYEGVPLTVNSPDELYKRVVDARRRGALLFECPFCIAPIGERCQSDSGRLLRDPHWSRLCAWSDLDMQERARLAALAELRTSPPDGIHGGTP